MSSMYSPDSFNTSEPMASLAVMRKKHLHREHAVRLGTRIAVVAAVLATIFAVFATRPAQASLVLTTPAGTRIFQGPVVQGMTVLDAIAVSSKAGKIPMATSVREHSMYLASFFNYSGQRIETLRVKVNGQQVSIPQLDNIPLHKGDVVVITTPDVQ